MNLHFKNVICVLFFFSFMLKMNAQEKKITGVVSDSAGPLPGVNVILKGTTIGTETDFDGKYSLKAKTGDVLVFSFVGMQVTERVVGAASELNILMKEDTNILDEIVVVGYGTTTKQSFTGTAKVVKTEDLEAKSVSNVSQALAGEVAGVNVINTSGQPGTVATIRIRGFGSVNGNRDPLYVVDGVPFSGSINSINPSDIASTTVLKDASATAIYGSRGANGVIMITTKAGRSGDTSVEIDLKTGVNFQFLPRYDVIKSPDEYLELSWHAMANRGLDIDPTTDAVAFANANLFSDGIGVLPAFNYFNTTDVSQIIDPLTGKVRPGLSRKYTPESWSDYAFQPSVRTEANIKMSGGNDKTKYFSSFGYLDDKGYSVNSGYKRYAARLNLTHKPADWLTAKANVGYTLSKSIQNGQSEDSGSIFWYADNIPSIYPLFKRDANGNFIEDSKYGGNQFDYRDRGFGGGTNAIGDAMYNNVGAERHSLNGNFSFKVDIAEGLEFETQYGAQHYSRIYNNVQNPFYGFAKEQGGTLYQTKSSALTQNFLNIFRYNKSFGDHNISALAAHETNQREYEISTLSKNTIVNLQNGITDANNYINVSSPPTGYKTKTALESYFGQVSYNYLRKYYLSGAIRRDGSSRFFQKKWGTFGSVGASWVMSEENFMNNVEFVNFLKLKASYGILGDQAGVDIYSGQDTYTIGNLGGEISLRPNAIQNPNLTWETSKMFQTGLEFTLFNNIIDGSVDYYIKNTEDLIFETRLAPSTGNAILDVNDGKLRNSGLEFDVTAHLVEKESFKLDFGVNGEMYDNELTQMPIDPANNERKLLDISDAYGRAKGRGIYDFYMREWAGVDSQTGNPLWTQYYHDANNNGVVDSGEGIGSLYEYKALNPDKSISKTTTSKYSDATQKYINKSIIPSIRGAFRFNAKYHDFTLSTLFGYSLGGYSYDYTYAGLMDNDQVGANNWHTDIRNSWKNPGDITDVPRLISDRNVQVNSRSSRFITSTDYLSLSNVRLGYTIPSNLIEKSGVKSLNFWVSGDNLFLLSARDGFNPTTSETGSSDVYRYQPLTTITFGVRAKF